MKHSKLIVVLLVISLLATAVMFTACDGSEDAPVVPEKCSKVCPQCGSCYDDTCTEEGHEEKCECVVSDSLAIAKLAEKVADDYKDACATCTASFEVPNSLTYKGYSADHKSNKDYVATVAWSVEYVSGVEGGASVEANAEDSTKTNVVVNYVTCSTETKYNLVATITIGEATTTQRVAMTIPAAEYKTIAEFRALEDSDEGTYIIKGWIVADASTSSTSSFVLADSTGAIFSYNKFEVEFGQCVYAVGTRSTYSGAVELDTTNLIARTPDESEVCPYEAQKSAIAESETFAVADATVISNYVIADHDGKLLKFTGLHMGGDSYINAYVTVEGEEVQILQCYGLGLANYVGADDVVVYGYCRGATSTYITLMITEIEAKGSLTVESNNSALVSIKNGEEDFAGVETLTSGTSYSLAISAIGEGNSIKSVTLDGEELVAEEGLYNFTVYSNSTLKVIVYNANANAADQVAFEKESLTFDKDAENVLVGGAYEDITIAWSTDNANFTFEGGKLTMPETAENGAVVVNVTATITYHKEGEEDVVDTKVFEKAIVTIGYGTAENPLTVEQALAVANTLEKGQETAQAVYARGEVEKMGAFVTSSTGSYYKNVYIKDASGDILIYTISLGEGVTGFYVGDTIDVVGYIKNYNGTLEFTASSSKVYVYATAVTSGARKVTVSGENATVTDEAGTALDADKTYADGDSFTFKVAAAEGYRVDTVKINGTEVTANESGVYTCTIAGPTTIAVTCSEEGSAQLKVSYTLTFAKNSSNSAYANMYEVKVGDLTWLAPGNQYENSASRIGGKNLTEVDRVIYGKDAISGSIEKIVLTTGVDSGSAITVNSLKIEVYSSAEDCAAGDSAKAVSVVNGTYAANSEITFAKPESAEWKDCYYRIVFNVTVGSSNKYVTFVKAEFYTAQ